MAAIQDPTSLVVAKVETQHQAFRVTVRPQEIGNRGAYHAAFYTGVLPAALGANSEIFQFRFVSAGGLVCLMRSIRVSASVSTTAFAAGVPIAIEGRTARTWTVQGTLGTGITFGSNDAKKRTDHQSTILAAGDVRIATTAALGVGTKTLDGTPFSTVTGQVGTGVLTIIPQTDLWNRDSADEYPLLFETQEGFVIRVVEVPATGTWKASVQIEWAEVDPTAVLGW
jgi:hypothetical protein